ncbi:MAG: fumarylacetoacetate hydrolase family protein [Salaquimonas sp.]|jgi:2-keto-4-pentenoate hydratase/2-oxohepta-3-ene-1,7-dioic acid hydratase in catechol pathway|nr:fumarylacetoacetate hydrolase family protein [Salaquimonas sp.]
MNVHAPSRPCLSSFLVGGEPCYGLVRDNGIVDLSARHPWSDLRQVIAAGKLVEISETAAGLGTDYAFDDVVFTIPLSASEKVICVGVNYPDPGGEHADGQDTPDYPSLFIRFPRSFVGHRQPVVCPAESPQFDYEGEIAIVIGRPGRRITERNALSHVAALTLCNEGSVRDWLCHGESNVTQGKNFDSSGSMGPWLIPFEEENQIADIRLVTRVNGEVRQDDRTSRMIFPFRKLIAYISTFTTLVPGDIIITGTPTVADDRLNPSSYLVPGDVVEVEAEGIGILSNPVVGER